MDPRRSTHMLEMRRFLSSAHLRGRWYAARFLTVFIGCVLALSVVSSAFANDDSEQILAIDHFVSHVSSAPVLRGETVRLYVRERVAARMALMSPSFSRRVVLFV